MIVRHQIEDIQTKLDLKQEEEWGIGDSGFNGMNSLNIHVPPNRTSDSFKEYSSYRVRVENTFAKMKKWNCCCLRMREKPTKENDLISFHNMLWTIVASFVNRTYF